MKFTSTIFFALLVGVLGYVWNPEELECVEELKLIKAEIEIFDNPWDQPTPENSKIFNDYLECKWKKQGGLKDNSEIEWNKIYDITVDDVKQDMENSSDYDEVVYTEISKLLNKAINKCREQNIQGDTAGQTVAKVQNCVGQQLRELIEVRDFYYK
ncbi:hypothetical protein ILUMI_11384 [Ignelater luminosus]|uniref:Uncharacterized protein n=1 Tax=Ignelater luminosus TaxID=2038154 RepID=A0A8K0D544_IGNLU|nr:hypothetical protein ILUMI_11384 [Ignelater luminosus]